MPAASPACRNFWQKQILLHKLSKQRGELYTTFFPLTCCSVTMTDFAGVTMNSFFIIILSFSFVIFVALRVKLSNFFMRGVGYLINY